MSPPTLWLLVVLVAVFATASNGQELLEPFADGEPSGRVLVKEAMVNKSLIPGGEISSVRFYVSCETVAMFGQAPLTDLTVFGGKASYPVGHDTHIELLTFETVKCELQEMLFDGTSQVSHGQCDFSYKDFLVHKNNTVKCKLQEGSRIKLQLDCEGGCPEHVPRSSSFCNGTQTLPDASFGTETTFGDGSPGYEKYAPNTICVWRIPKPDKGLTNIVFTRFDLGAGDVVTIYESIDGELGHQIKQYEEHHAPESVHSPAPFILIKFESDGKKEGLGFFGYYYETEVPLPTNGRDGPLVEASQVTVDPHIKDTERPEANYYYHESGSHLVESNFVPVTDGLDN